MADKKICCWYENKKVAEKYVNIRPKPPQDLIDKILGFLKEKYVGDLNAALDVGCGPGHGTNFLAPHFKTVTGIDISEAQINQAILNNKHGNITYKVGTAEELPVGDNTQQLVTAFVAAHYFNLPKFFAEVERVLVPGGIVALCGYISEELIYERESGQVSVEVFQVIEEVFGEFLSASYYKTLLNKYQDMTFPFSETRRIDDVFILQSGTVGQYFDNFKSAALYWEHVKKYGQENTDKVLKNQADWAIETFGVASTPETTPIKWKMPYFSAMARKALS